MVVISCVVLAWPVALLTSWYSSRCACVIAEAGMKPAGAGAAAANLEGTRLSDCFTRAADPAPTRCKCGVDRKLADTSDTSIVRLVTNADGQMTVVPVIAR